MRAFMLTLLLFLTALAVTGTIYWAAHGNWGSVAFFGIGAVALIASLIWLSNKD